MLFEIKYACFPSADIVFQYQTLPWPNISIARTICRLERLSRNCYVCRHAHTRWRVFFIFNILSLQTIGKTKITIFTSSNGTK